jgi:hypothetical protein
MVQVARLGDGEAGERVVGLYSGPAPSRSTDLTEDERRDVELGRLMAVGGITAEVAEPMYADGLTLARIAAVDDRRRAEIEAQVAKHLPAGFPLTAAQVVDEARGFWERTHGSGRT